MSLTWWLWATSHVSYLTWWLWATWSVPHMVTVSYLKCPSHGDCELPEVSLTWWLWATSHGDCALPVSTRALPLLLDHVKLAAVQSLSRVWLLQPHRLPGSSVHGIFQARILERVAISFSRGSSWPRDRTRVSCLDRHILYRWATWKP